MQVCGCELERCQLWQGSVSSFAADWLLQSPPRYKPLLTLTLDLVGPMPSLARLLSALQPAGMQAPAFQRLELEGVLPEPAAMAGCTQLQQLQQLSMCVGEYETDPDGLRLALPVLLKQASRLASLSTDGYKLGSPLPGCLRSYCGLTRLALLYHSLTDLPAGEYLQGRGRIAV